MLPTPKIFKMATGLKAGLYQNAQSASYFPLILGKSIFRFVVFVDLSRHTEYENVKYSEHLKK